MKIRLIISALITILIATLANPVILAQTESFNHLKERYSLITDRALYSAGENIFFSVKETGIESLSDDGLSKVLYADIISPDGQIVNSAKYAIKEGKTNASLQIPSETPSGTWYLRVYSKWLRNFKPADMTFISVKIINPATLNHLPVDTSVRSQADLIKLESTNRNKAINIRIPKEEYTTGEKVLVEIENLNRTSSSDYIVSVIPDGSVKNQLKNLPDVAIEDAEFNFIPEIHDISLTGKVKNHDEKNSEVFTRVYLTLLDKERNFYPAVTDSAGNFFFNLPAYTGIRDLFISVKNAEGDSLEVLIDSDIATGHLTLPSLKLDLDSTEYAAALQIIRNQQLKKQFFPDSIQDYKIEPPGILFYGTPSRSVEIGEYIDLPSMEEYFLELLPMVRVIRNKGKVSFRVNGPQAELSIYDPVVMIDGVVVHDNEAVLAINPQRVARIDIVDRPYIRGENIFGGVISILSRNNDFAGVDLPSSGLFLTYRFYEPDTPYPQSFIPDKPHLPDPRNTLYWNPNLKLGPGEKHKLEFSTAHDTGTYLIMVSTIGENGEILRDFREIRVRHNK